MVTEQKTVLHLGIAERGKLHALDGNFAEALRHYREAIRLSQGQGEIFFQHYSQCVMEALELQGAHEEVISCSEKFLDFLNGVNMDEPELLNRLRATHWERVGVQYLHLGEKSEAVHAFKEAMALGGKGKQPLSAELMNWAQRGYTISKKQVQDIQKKYNYFIVRKDKVNAAIAVDLPKAFSPF